MHDPRRLTNPQNKPTLVDAQATYYPDMVQIYIPKEPILRNPTGLKNSRYFTLEEEAGLYKKETNQERSIRRSKKKIGDYILCNSFDLFVTLTIKDDRQNSNRSKQKVLNWLKNQRNRNGKFRYITTPEYHKDNQSLHFHALFGDYTGKIAQAVNPKTGRPLVKRGTEVYQIDGYKLGFSNARVIGGSQEDRRKLAAYLKKYVTKDMPTFEGRQRYWVSKGLDLPLVEDNPEEWYKHVEPDWIKENENGTIMRFDLNKNPLTDMFWESKQ